MRKQTLKRRTFLKTSTLAGAGFAIGFTFGPFVSLANGSGPSVSRTKGAELGLWVRIASDGTITLIAPSSEMGQGVNTSLSMIIAEELEADWQSIKTETAPAHSDYKNPNNPLQFTGGSSSLRGFWEPLREVGAAAREMLKTAAAQKWDVPVNECEAKSGKILHKKSGCEIGYGELAEAAGKLDVPSDPVLKSPEDYELIGKPVTRFDLPAKVTGSAQFGIDVRIPGMLFATVRQSPVFEGEVLSFDETAAKNVRGVVAVVQVSNGIAVVADNTWRAKKGMEALNPQFKDGKTAGESSMPGLDSQQVREQFLAALDDEGKGENDAEHAAAGLPFLDLEYEVPFLAYATLEPRNCTAYVRDDFCEVWAPTQNQEMSMDAAKDITDLDEDQIRIHTTLLGGGFGRRLETDYVKQAVTVSKLLEKPVQLTWMREEDIQHDFYRPASISRFQISLGRDGFPLKWENQLAAPSILKRYFSPLGWFGFDPTSTEGADVLPYAIPDFDFDYSLVDPGVPVGFGDLWEAHTTLFTHKVPSTKRHIRQNKTRLNTAENYWRKNHVSGRCWKKWQRTQTGEGEFRKDMDWELRCINRSPVLSALCLRFPQMLLETWKCTRCGSPLIAEKWSIPIQSGHKWKMVLYLDFQRHWAKK